MTPKFINAVAILIFLVAAFFIFVFLNSLYQGAPETCTLKSKNPFKKHLSTCVHFLSLCVTQKPSERSSSSSSRSEVPLPGKPACAALPGRYFPPLKMYFTQWSGLKLGMKGKVEV